MVFEFGTALAVAAASASPADTRIVEVPFTWSLTPYGDHTMTRSLRNEGGSGNVVQVAGTLLGGFEVGFSHSPPAGNLGRLDPLPETVSVQWVARVSGVFTNPSYDVSLPFVGLNYQTYVGVTASVDMIGAIPDQEFRGTSYGSIDSEVTAVRSVGPGNLDFSGALNLSSLYGAWLVFKDPITAVAHLDVTANVARPTTMVRYLVAVPEMTSTGMAFAGGLLAFAGLWRWKRKG